MWGKKEKLVTVKVRRINSIEHISRTFETEDVRYKNVRFDKLIKLLEKMGISYTVGFHNNTMITNVDYLEVYPVRDICQWDSYCKFMEEFEKCIKK